MANLSELREGIADRLKTIDGLRVSEFQPDAIRPPVAFVLPDRVTYDLNANRGVDNIIMVVTVVVSRADERTAQRNADQFVFGAKSVKTAIEADRTLGGKANTCRVTEMRNYNQLVAGEITYLAVEFEVEVWA